MKFIYNLVIVIIIVPLLFSCSPDGTINHSYTEIKIDQISDQRIPLSTICSELRYLPLRGDQLIGSVDKISFKDHIIIFDKSTPAIHTFDYEGDHVYSFSILEGNGPNELQFISDYHLVGKERVDILGYQKIVSYAFTGEPVDETVLSVLPLQLTQFKGKSVFYFGNSVYSTSEVQNHGYKLLTISDDGRIQNEYIPIEEYKSKIRYQPRDNFPEYDGRQLFYTNPETYIYELTEKGLSKRYYLNYGDAAIPDGYFAEVSRLDNVSLLMDQVFSDGYVSLLHDVIETKEVVYFQFHTSFVERSSMAIYSKDSGYVTTGKGLENDVDGGVAPSSFSVNFDDEWLAGTIYPMDLSGKENQIRNIPESNLYDILNGSSALSESNPVIVKCKPI